MIRYGTFLRYKRRIKEIKAKPRAYSERPDIIQELERLNKKIEEFKAEGSYERSPTG